MKKLIILLIFIAVVTPVFAQANFTENPNAYVFNFPIERIFPTNRGYVIQYRGQKEIHTIGVPNDWFTGPTGKADKVVLPRGRNWPSMSVFFSDGDFSHVRIYVHAHRSHRTWMTVQQGTDVSRFFSDDSFDIRF
jgi:hypothetical protein